MITLLWDGIRFVGAYVGLVARHSLTLLLRLSPLLAVLFLVLNATAGPTVAAVAFVAAAACVLVAVAWTIAVIILTDK